MRGRMRWAAVAAMLVLVVAVVLGVRGCHERTRPPPPPRVTTAAQMPQQLSTVVVPVTIPLTTLQRALEAKLPRQLWSIDKQQPRCIPPQRVKILGASLKVTPALSCRIVGTVHRGSLRLSGAGKRLIITLPVQATISARNVGGVLKETATGAALVRTDGIIGLTRDWAPTAKVAIAYDWTDPPGIDFLGQRITLVSRADKELARVVKGLERDLQGEVGRLKLRPLIEGAWRQAFTVIELNGRDPPAWMRVTPMRAGVLDYRIQNGAIVLTVVAEARTETFVGRKPPANPPTPLPAQIGGLADNGLKFFIPVLADYDQLEPVVLRALRKLNERGIVLPRVGRVDAHFDKVTIYATQNNRLAVGIDARVEAADKGLIRERWGKAKGQVWLTGQPVQDANSEVVRIRDLQILGYTDSATTDLLLQLANSDVVRQEVAGSLTQDFSKDYKRVLDKAQAAIANKRVGDFVLAVKVDTVSHQVVAVTGAGLLMPIEVTGRARITFQPGGKR